MAFSKPIYELICEHLQNGHLPEGFDLADPGSAGQTISFAPGALDGVTIYHTRGVTMSPEDVQKMAAALSAASNGHFSTAYDGFKELGGRYRAIGIIDPLQHYIREHAMEFDQSELFRFAIVSLVTQAVDIECVKFGLAIIEVYGELNVKVKEVIRQLGQWDEFSLFAIWNMMTWDNASDEIYELARYVHGWGRVHAVQKLEPTRQEMRDWLLFEGIHNTVMPEYSALAAFEKSGAAERLEGNLTLEEFEAISELISTLLSGGPVAGITGLENSEEVLRHYLEKAERFPLDISAYDTIRDILDYSREEPENPNLIVLAERILSSDACKECEKAARSQNTTNKYLS